MYLDYNSYFEGVFIFSTNGQLYSDAGMIRGSLCYFSLSKVRSCEECTMLFHCKCCVVLRLVVI